MRRRLSLLAVLLVGAAVLTPTVAPVQDAPPGHGGYTDVRVDGDTVVIVVNLTVVYAIFEDEGPPSPEAVRFVEDGFAAAQKFWNDAFDFVGGCPKLRVELNVRFATTEGFDAVEPPGHQVNPYSHFRSGEFPDGRGLPTVEFPGLPPDTPGDTDITYPYDEQSIAYMPDWLFEDPWALAHELGHLFGLGDDYRDGEVIEGREGTLMAGTLGGDYVDRSILGDISSVAQQAGYRLPECWEGTYEGTLDAGGPGNCGNEFDGTFGITVDQNGIATMEGTGTSQTFCAGQAAAPFTSKFVAMGERTSSGFRFENATPYGPGLLPLLTIEVTGDEGTGHFEGPSGAGAGSATIDFEVSCSSCGPPG